MLPQPSTQTPAQAQTLREALAPYVNLRQLRRLAAQDCTALEAALTGKVPALEVVALLEALRVLLRPLERERISGPADVAALLMVEMACLTQEQLQVVCLTTKNHVQAIHTVYQGSVKSACVRIAEVFHEPIRRNSSAIILPHNHPSDDPTPSLEDIAVTRQVVEAGRLLDVDVLDHLIIGHGRWTSLRERKSGFEG